MEAERIIRVPTTGVFDFESLITNEKAKYVDKTDLLYQLCDDADQQLFISRPRRFGKSLMLSTLKAMFEGRRDLFRGLAIDKLPWEGWEHPTPVYSFTMASATGATYELFLEQLAKLVRGLCAEAGVPYSGQEYAPGQFEDFLKAAAAKSPTKKIVVLIDEYDEPVAKFLDDIASLNKVRSVLHDFYEKLKNNSGSIRFLLMTGVTKLTKLSVFSGMNHLKDRSMDRRFATLLGYTPDELDGALRENVEALGSRNGMDFAEAKAEILSWYDGYRFSPDSDERVCNPVSLGNALEAGKLKGYWETTGRATLIINRIERAGKLPEDLENVPADAFTLDVCDAETLPMESLLYQGGYLTIKDVICGDPRKEETDRYILAPPNHEVREALKRGYLSQVMGLKVNSFNTLVDRAKRQIASGDWKGYLYESLYGLYASVPPDWHIRDEAEAKRYFQLFSSMTGANPQPEVASMLGYADAVIETQANVFVFEFKYRRSAKAAIRQIRDRGYADKWIGGERPVTLIGINFNPKKRNIDIPAVEPA
ncbi:MAG: AAA family ATPase [Kiritimatiellae bacterium]|nr:AAA family ATPase [Kiritimatiellia bacterium]MBQ3340887.1 AAA family ATPase [Kiritimatiellia bacterium]